METKLGLIHIYCGNGKGKTTAAMGTALRSACCGYRVLIAQFLKDGDSSELAGLDRFENVTILSGKCEPGFTVFMTEQQKENVMRECNEYLDRIISLFRERKYDVIVLDEILDAINCNFITEEKVCAFLEEAQGKTEVILTGRNPGESLCAAADYISEVRKVKHPYDKGIKARKGIEK